MSLLTEQVDSTITVTRSDVRAERLGRSDNAPKIIVRQGFQGIFGFLGWSKNDHTLIAMEPKTSNFDTLIEAS